MKPTPLLLLGLATVACSNMNIQKQYQEMRPAMLRGDFKTAAAQVEQAKKSGVYKEQDRVMFWLNHGTLLHYAGEYDRSMAQLVNAEKAMKELWTKSISSEASKFLLNETAQPYPGEDYEKILLYLYTSLNNVKKGNMQKALVEARAADEFLKKMQIHYEKEGGIGTIYTQDAFMLWLVGLYYEIEGSLAEASLAYKAAYDAYEKSYRGTFGVGPPSFLAEDIVRTAGAASNPQLASQFKGKGGTGQTAEKLAQGMAEIILIHANGEAPKKIEYTINHKMKDGYVSRIALAKYQKIPHRIDHAIIEVAGTTSKGETAEPVTIIALKNFARQKPGLVARAIARAVAKYLATKGTQKAVSGDGKDKNRKVAGALLGLAGNITAAATEAADLRSWTTLPSEIDVARLWVPPGSHTVNITFHSAGGGKLGRTVTETVDVKNGQRRIISVRTFQ